MAFILFVLYCLSLCGRITSFRTISSNHRALVRGHTTLEMNLFDRFARVVKGTANQIVSGMEDPEKVLDQAVADMQNDLVKIRQSYAEIFASQKRAQKQKEDADKLADDWYRRAQLALEKDDDELAKEALTRRQIQVDISEGLVSTIENQAISIEKLYASMQQLDLKITDAKRQKDAFVARARTAKTSTKVTDLLNNVGGSNSMEAFDRMKAKVETLEAQAEVAGELAASTSTSATMEDRFKALESGDRIDDELAKMKNMKALPGSEKETALLPEIVQEEPKSELDMEYEKLKKELGK